MKKMITFVALLCLGVVATGCKKDKGEEPTVNPADYQLSADGKTLIKWLNPETTSLNMQDDVNLRQVTIINEGVFERFGNLSSVKLPDNLEIIGKDAFSSTSITSVEIPKKITRIEEATFALNTKLSSVTLNEGLRFLGYATFAGCTKLEAITLPSTLSVISRRAFERTGLYTIAIPKSVTKIEPLAFVRSSSLTSITLEAQTPPLLEFDKETNSDAFYDVPIARIYVPATSVATYKTAEGWKNYADKIFPAP